MSQCNPDSCDIVDVNSGEKALNNEQRKNLGSVAKVLQFAASKKGFGDESPHLQCLNQVQSIPDIMTV